MPSTRAWSGRLLVTATVVVSAAIHAAAQHPADLPAVRLEGVAPKPAQVPPLPAVRLSEGGRAADLDSSRAVSLTFAQPLAIRDVLLLLFRGTSFSIVFEPGASGTFIGELSSLTLRQALEAVLVPAGLDYAVKGPVVRVFPRQPQTRLFEVSQLAVRRAFQRRVRSVTADTASADLSTDVESDFFAELAEGVRSLLSPAGRMHVDRHAGVVQVTDFADRVEQVGLYIEAVTLRASRQLRLHAQVLEVVVPAGAAVDWRAIAGGAGARTGTGAGVRIDDVGRLIQAIGAVGAVRIVGSPQLLAMNNEPAVMRVGTGCAAFAAGSTGAVAACGNGAERGAAGGAWTLTITPQIAADGIVHMSVSPTFVEPSRAPGGLPSVIESDTTMRVQDGDTVLIAGWPREGPQNGSGSRKELLILLTPTVVTPGSSPVAGGR